VPRPSAFTWRLGAIAAVALAIRVVYDVVHRTYIVLGDAMTFHQVAQHLADGSGFIQPFTLTGAATAEHPPGYEVFLAAFDVIGANGYLSHRLAGAVVGTAVVVLIALLGRRVAGPTVGLVAAAIAAVYPVLWTADGAVMSETLYGFFVVLSLLAALALRERPTRGRAATLGAAIALAALTRGEAIGLLALLVVPVAWAGAPALRGRAVLLGVSLLAFAVLLAPWTIRNLSTFSTPTLISTNANGLFVGANCHETYYGDLVGSWRFQCYTKQRPGEDEAAYFVRQRGIGLRYARDHAGRLPVVMAARVGRLFDVYKRPQAVFLNSVEGRPAGPTRWALRTSVILLVLAIAGAAIMAARRRRGELLILLAPVAMVVAVALVSYGTTRFRHAAEPSFCVLGAVAVTAAAGRLRDLATSQRTARATTRPV